MSTVRLSVLGGLLVTLVAWAALTATHKSLRAPVPPQRAIAAARQDPIVQGALRGVRGGVDAAATPVDSQMERVTFTSAGRILAEIAVYRSGAVGQAISYRAMTVPYGSSLAYQPWLLALLACVFVLCTGVAPLRRVRNLDVIALLSLLAPMILLELRYVELGVAASVPALVYLLVRCARIAFARGGAPAPSQRPLFDVLTARWDHARRARTLRMMLGALALVFLMVCVSSSQPVDVLFALMEGATKIVHGVLPYGHMPGDVVHGDTYPLLSYLVYVPLAKLAPVRDNWDSVDLGLALAALCAIAAAAMLAGRSALALRRPGRGPGDTTSLRTALAWLSFPPLLAIASTGTSDVVLAAMLLGVVIVWRRPRGAAALLAVATWFKLAPAVLVPPFLASLRGRRWWALAVIAAVSAVPLAILLALGGTSGVRSMIDAVGWQFNRGSPQSVWSVLGIGGLQPLGQAGVLGLVAGASIMIRRDESFSGQPVRIAALVAAILIALQLSADYWAFLYLAWILPPLSLCLLGAPLTTGEALEPAKSSPGWRVRSLSTGAARNLRAPVAQVPVGRST